MTLFDDGPRLRMEITDDGAGRRRADLTRLALDTGLV